MRGAGGPPTELARPHQPEARVGRTKGGPGGGDCGGGTEWRGTRGRVGGVEEKRRDRARAAMALRNSKAGKFATGSSLVAVQAAMATGARALGIWRGMLVAAAAVAARPPLIELDGETLLHIVSGGGFGRPIKKKKK